MLQLAVATIRLFVTVPTMQVTRADTMAEVAETTSSMSHGAILDMALLHHQRNGAICKAQHMVASH